MASKINADEFVDREGENKPTLPKGVVLSGVTTITTAVVDGNEVANTGGINAGIITSTHFAGNLTGDVNAGIVTVTSQSVIGSGVTISASGIDIGAGVITATSYAGSGANLTGIGATIMIWEYNPDPYDTAVTFDTGIGITFNQKIKAGSGNITLSIANAGVAGTVVENFGIGNSVTISNNELSFTPTTDLAVEAGQYCITLPSGVITNMAGESYVGTAYTFETMSYTRQAWVWGRQDDYGHLGINNKTQYSSPVQLPGTPNAIWSNFSSDAQLLISKDSGTLWVAGHNKLGSAGQLGQNNQTEYSSPVQVPGTWAVSANMSGSVFGTKTDGTLWAWGNGENGQLAQNNKTEYSSPVQIGSDTTWGKTIGKLGGAQKNVLAIKTDGTLWSWGDNEEYGQLADNSQTDRSSPIQIPGTNWLRVGRGMGTGSNGAVKTDGTLWVWGLNSHGNLGQNIGGSPGSRSSPVQIPGTTWANIYFGYSQAAATKTDGTLWMWGLNTNGVLGQNNRTSYSSPVQVGSGTDWGTDYNNFHVQTHAGGVKTDGTLWVWGDNGYGVLGQNSLSIGDYSSPVQVPGNWQELGLMSSSIIAIKKV